MTSIFIFHQAKVQKEIQERDAKLKAVGGSAKSNPHLDVNAQDDEEEDQDQQGPTEDSPTLNRVGSLERQGEHEDIEISAES